MKKILAVILIFWAGQNAFSQSAWVVQNPTAYHPQVRNIFMLNSNTGFACGSGGNVIKTTDGGNLWTSIGSGIDFYAMDVFFLDINTGWSCGMTGRLVKTTNGGTSWQQLQFIGYTQTINSVYFIDQNTGFAGFENGVIAKSTNGGVNWTKDSVYSFSVTGFKFFNQSTGYAIGNYGSIFKTTNTGQDWTELPITPETSQIYASDFINIETGYVATNRNVWKTTNSGLNWQQSLHTDYQYGIKSMSFLNNQTGYTTLYSGQIYKTENSGLNWTLISSPVSTIIQILAVAPDKNFLISGEMKIYRSLNGGANWTAYSNSVTQRSLEDVKFFNESTGYIIGDSGVFLKTTNGGSNWQLLPIFTDERLRQMYFLNPMTGWVSGDNGTIMRTTNGGINWQTPVSRLPKNIFSSVFFVNSSTGYTLSGNGKLFKTTDEGMRWTQLTIPSAFSYGKVYFLNEATGFCSGYDGYDFVIKTTNAGESWSEIISSGATNSSLFFLNENTGYGSGYYRLSKTTDGGLNWMQINYNMNYFFNNVHFLNEQTGYACGTSGTMCKTTNGGQSWGDISVPVFSASNKIFFVNDSIGWLICTDGSIFKTTTGGVLTGFTQNSLPVPDKYFLSQNYPNPFNPSTRINYELRNTNYVTLKVFDLLGKEVATLVNDKQSAGTYAVDFNSAEFNLPSGIYFYTLNAGEFQETRKMVLVK
ncbi:MAG: T9SS type A sorting domain-containing protein [Bacteroidetes bacterium]|nr:T9SS type A sorting domain-containing protein [Bacteroidota bacterium]